MIYVFLADGFEETEAIAPIDMLRRAKLDVKLVGVGTSTPHELSRYQGHCRPYRSRNKAGQLCTAHRAPRRYARNLNLEKSPVVQSAIKYCVEKGIPVGAICAAPSILGKLGLLKRQKSCLLPRL